MPAATTQSAASERIVSALNGWGVLIVNIALILAAILMHRMGLAYGAPARFVGLLSGIIGILMLPGYFTLQPNQARVLILFGAYKGTVRSSGFHWANPFYARARGALPPKAGLSGADSSLRNRLALRSGVPGYQT